MLGLEVVGRNKKETLDDESLNSMSSIDLHSRTMAAEYEAIHLKSSRPASPVNMVVSKSPGGSMSRSDSAEWPEVSVQRSNPPEVEDFGSLSKLELFGRSPIRDLKVENVFEHRKGKPIARKGPATIQQLPDTVKVLGKMERSIPDDQLINVTKFTLVSKESNLPTMTPATLNMVRYDEDIRGVNDRMRLVSTPALSFRVPMEEARNLQHSKRAEKQRMRRYGVSVPPLRRISHLEKDLARIIRRRKTQRKDVVKREYLSPPPTRGEYRLGSPQQPGSREGSLAYSDVWGDGADVMSTGGLQDGHSVIFSECSDRTMNSYVKITNDCDDGEVDEEGDKDSAQGQRDISIPTDLRVQRVGDATAFALATQAKREEASKSRASSAMASTASERVATGDATVVEQLYRLDDGGGGRGQTFQHTKDKLLSRKDKVYDCGSTSHTESNPTLPTSAGGGQARPTNPLMDDLPLVTRVPSQDHDGQPTGESMISVPKPVSADPRGSMNTRYSSGKLKLEERTSQSTLPGYIRRTVDVEVELKARVVCVSCGVEAAMWCIECERSYCPYCWNKVPHHEFVDPDEVWVNRRPAQPMLPSVPSEKGIQVHINAKGQVSQGLPHNRRKGNLRATKGKLRMNRMSSFPAPSTIADKGFVYAQTWAALDDDISVSSEANKSTVSKPPARLNVQVDEDMTNCGRDYLDAISQHEDLEDSTVETESKPSPVPQSSKKSPYVRTTTTRRSPEKPPRVLSERAKSPSTLMWQVATGRESKSGGLVQVSRVASPVNAVPMQGITAEYFPDDWQESRAGISRTFEIHQGRSVATRKLR